MCPPPRTAKVPDIIGQTEASALNALEAAGFAVRAGTTQTKNCRDGKVTKQDPDADHEVVTSTQISYTVCRRTTSTRAPESDDRARVPCASNHSEGEAAAMMRDVELVPAPTYVESQ